MLTTLPEQNIMLQNTPTPTPQDPITHTVTTFDGSFRGFIIPVSGFYLHITFYPQIVFGLPMMSTEVFDTLDEALMYSAGLDLMNHARTE